MSTKSRSPLATPGSLLRAKWQLFCAAAFLATGAALLAYIASGISLLATSTVSVVLAAIGLHYVASRLDAHRRRELKLRIMTGFAVGAIATLAYDLSRFALIEITGIHFWPFDIFRVFGQGIVGPNWGARFTRTVGFLYHVSNGLCFGVAYTILWGQRGILVGIGFAFFLELCMVTVYPGWLGLKALREFMQVSIFGHLVYGSCLGYISRQWLRKATTSRKDVADVKA